MKVLVKNCQITIDEDDYSVVENHTWHIFTASNGSKYARTNIKNENGKYSPVYMHQLILGTFKTGKHVDHVNRDTLDNRRGNLRVVTHEQNMHNRKPPKNKTGFVNVALMENGKYRARISEGNKRKHLGCFASAEEAALAVDEYVIKFRQGVGHLNIL